MPASLTSTQSRLQMRRELRERLRQNRFTHFVSLASNAALISEKRMRDLLKEWDQRMNRFILGPRWLARPDARMVWFAFLEKPGANPHWHLLAEVDQLETPSQRRRIERFDLEAKAIWCKLLPSGSVDVQRYRDGGAIDYSTKDFFHDDALDRFTSSLELIRN